MHTGLPDSLSYSMKNIFGPAGVLYLFSPFFSSIV